MKQNVDKYNYDELNEARDILRAIGMPVELYRPRSVMIFASVARVKSGKWNKVSEEYVGTHDMIAYINMHYPNKGGLDKKDYSENSRESFRKDTVYPWIEAGILEAKPGLPTNDKNNSYRFTSVAAGLFRHYGTPDWEDHLNAYLENHQTYSDLQKQVKDIDLGYEVDYNGLSFHLGRSAHNKLQKLILERFARIFSSKAELLYIGDTKDKDLCKNDERMKELGIDVFDKTAKIPDIVLFDNDKKRLLLIEAYSSTGEFNVDRVKEIKKALNISPDIEVAFITAFSTTRKMLQVYKRIAWDTDIWVSEDETHMTHKNGDHFIGRKLNDDDDGTKNKKAK